MVVGVFVVDNTFQHTYRLVAGLLACVTGGVKIIVVRRSLDGFVRSHGFGHGLFAGRDAPAYADGNDNGNGGRQERVLHGYRNGDRSRYGNNAEQNFRNDERRRKSGAYGNGNAVQCGG